MGAVTALCKVLDDGLPGPASEEDIMACLFVLTSYSSNCDILVEEKVGPVTWEAEAWWTECRHCLYVCHDNTSSFPPQ
jgi:hypothetical protein